MANSYIAVPAPVGDGVGTPVSMVGQGLKTFVIGGDFDATVFIEIGIGGRFAPLFELDKAEQFRNVPCVAEQVRIRVTKFRSGQPIVFVGSDSMVNTFASVPVPVGDGVGAPLDTSMFGRDKTLIVGGVFDARLTFEVSEDAAGPWAPVGRIDKTANLISQVVINRFVRVKVDRFRSGTPSVGVGGAELGGGGSVGVGSQCFVWQEGGGGMGPVVFGDYNDLETEKEAVRIANGGGCYTVLVDDSAVGGADIPFPIGGPFNYECTEFHGVDSPLNPSGTVIVEVLEGTTFTELLAMRRIVVRNRTTLTTACQIPNRATLFLNNAFMSTDGGGAIPFYDTVAVVAGGVFFVSLEMGSVIAQATTLPVINLANAGALMVGLMGAQSRFGGGGLVGVAGSVAVPVLTTESSQWADMPGFLGVTSGPNVSSGPRMPFDPPVGSGPAIAPFGLDPGDFARYDASGGPIAQVLPLLPLTGTSNDAISKFLIVRETSGTAGLTVGPAIGNTLNGKASPFALQIPAGGSALLIMDGRADYHVVAVFSPFGMDYLEAESAGRTTTAGAGFVPKVGITTPVLTGRYRVSANALVDSTATMQVQLQNVTDGVQVGGRGEYTPAAAGDRLAWAAKGEVVFPGIARTFEVQFRDMPPPAQVAGCSDAVIEFWRVP